MATDAAETWPGDFSLRVPFRDVDMHGHVHNAAYVSYCETAVTEFLRARALGAHFAADGRDVAYHVRRVEAIFDGPSTFGDELCFRVAVQRVGNTSVTFAVRVRGRDETASRVTATIVWVCVDVRQRRPVGLPAETRDLLAALADGPGAGEPEG